MVDTVALLGLSRTVGAPPEPDRPSRTWRRTPSSVGSPVVGERPTGPTPPRSGDTNRTRRSGTRPMARETPPSGARFPRVCDAAVAPRCQGREGARLLDA